MPIDPNAPQDPKTRVRTSERLWSQEVGAAEAQAPLPPKDPGYEFSNGRKFNDGDGPYAA
ncbi:hypothetical protein [Aromatoleum anaerobium]|uniref:Uncharacterized protein n=1 Tax=Aromatoleum anaerobium TaxID=182180 RepID=A0ABX1PQQ2_9RHOO|nr:hypothetical protein [Aromatoleum anaerobium]MCK0507919.1 hypothetical protein [Aromatoleum anaerobium]